MDDSKPAAEAASSSAGPSVTMVAKYGKQKIELSNLPSTSTTVAHVKDMLRDQTGILSKRQKLIGLKGNKGITVTDDTPLSDLKVKGSKGDNIVHQFILMGTPEEKIFVDPSQKDGLPDIIDDFDLDFNAGSEEWIQHKAKEDNLQNFTESTEIHVIHPPRAANENSNNDGTTITTSSAASCKPLLVLDLDHTLLDFSSSHLRDNGSSAMAIGQSTDAVANQLKRPYMDEFLTWTYKYYDLVVWSQTSWRWLEVSHLNLLRGFVCPIFGSCLWVWQEKLCPSFTYTNVIVQLTFWCHSFILLLHCCVFALYSTTFIIQNRLS